MSTYLCVYICLCTFIYICLRVTLYAFMRLHIYTHVIICICICLNMYLAVWYSPICIYNPETGLLYIYMYKLIHTQTYNILIPKYLYIQPRNVLALIHMNNHRFSLYGCTCVVMCPSHILQESSPLFLIVVNSIAVYGVFSQMFRGWASSETRVCVCVWKSVGMCICVCALWCKVSLCRCSEASEYSESRAYVRERESRRSCVCVCVFVFVWVCIYVWTHLCVYLCVRVRVRVRMCASQARARVFLPFA